MLIYAGTITASTLMFAVSGYMEQHKNKIFSGLFLIMAILIPCVIVGARDENIGTDTSLYGSVYFKMACNIESFTDFSKVTDTEWLYKVFSYYTARLFRNQFLYFLFPEVVIFVLVYFSVKRISNKKYTWLGMLLFELLYLSYSMNLMRQTITIAIYLYAFKYVEEKNLKKFLVFSITAFLIQMTSIIGTTIYPLYWATQNYKQGLLSSKNDKFWRFVGRYSRFIKLSTIVIVAIAIANLQRLLVLITAITGRYTAQIKLITEKSLNDFRYLLFCIPCFVLIYICKRKHIDARIDFFIYLFLLSILLYQCRQITIEAYRVSLYFSAFLVLLIPEITGSIKNIATRYVFIVGNVGIWGAYFYFYFIKWLWNETYPYTSSLLGIL